MPHKIGFVEASNGKRAHENMLEEVMNFTTANGWTLLRFIDSGDRHELILKAPGLSGTEEIFVGMQTYQNENADYYNLLAAGFAGYVPGNSFKTQPGFISSGVPAHNQRIDYWLTMNGQRLILVMKVGTPVYESCYIGKMLPFAHPSQYPYPCVVGGMLSGDAPTRFSDTTHSSWVKGNRVNMRLQFNSGMWLQPECYPWNNTMLTGTSQVRDTNGNYALLDITLSDRNNNIYGDLDGVSYIAGFNNAVENTVTLDQQKYIVVQDVSRNGFNDYFAIRMDD